MELKIETTDIKGKLVTVRVTRDGTLIVNTADDFVDGIAHVNIGHRRAKEIAFSVVIPANATQLIVAYDGDKLEARTDLGELMSAARYRIEQAREFARRHTFVGLADDISELIAKALEEHKS